MIKLLKFFVTLFAAIALSAMMAHLFALPVKMRLSQEAYYTVQGIYQDWAWLILFEFGAILLTLLVCSRERSLQPTASCLSLTLLCFVFSLAIFFLFTLPVNQVTLNWTMMSDDWELLRLYWEYSHALRAFLGLLGFGSLIIYLLQRSPSYARL